MKNITNSTKIITWILIISITSLAYWLNLQEKNIQIQKAKLEILKIKKKLIEAKKPSRVEIQKAELMKLETSWKNKEDNIKNLRKTAEKLEKEKLELEPKIRAKRNEILGLKK